MVETVSQGSVKSIRAVISSRRTAHQPYFVAVSRDREVPGSFKFYPKDWQDKGIGPRVNSVVVLNLRFDGSVWRVVSAQPLAQPVAVGECSLATATA